MYTCLTEECWVFGVQFIFGIAGNTLIMRCDAQAQADWLNPNRHTPGQPVSARVRGLYEESHTVHIHCQLNAGRLCTQCKHTRAAACIPDSCVLLDRVPTTPAKDVS